MALESLVILGCLGAIGVAGLRESLALSRARASVPIRIHVNGTRGKSTVTRLVHAGLRASGLTVLGKATGTAPRLLMPDGREEPIRRRGPANISEQAWVLRMAGRLGADALVVECMALRPELQRVTEHRMLRSTVGVMTNVRTDHTEVMGRTLAEIADALSGTVPRGAALVLGERREKARFREVAAALGTNVIDVSAVAGNTGGERPPWFQEDLAVALAVTRLLGIPDAVAEPAMLACPADPGAVRIVEVGPEGARIPCIDASAANDPESLRLLIDQLLPAIEPRDGPVLLLLNHRRDRPGRLLPLLGTALEAVRPAAVVVTGERPALSQWLALGRCGWPVSFVPVAEVGARIARQSAGCRAIVVCGNSRGLSVISDLGG